MNLTFPIPKIVFALTAYLSLRISGAADTAVVDGVEWTYSISHGEASIFNENNTSSIPVSTSGSVTIPSILGDCPVTSIGFRAFRNCTGLWSVTIPNSVKSIGGFAFCGCSGLASITIPNSVTNIGSGAFEGSGLTSIAIPDGVIDIDAWAFAGCPRLTSASIPDSVTNISFSVFLDCPEELFDLTSIPGAFLVDGWVVGHSDSASGNLDLSGIRGLCIAAFRDCSGLTSVSIPSTLTHIVDSAFDGCSGLTTVTIPDGVASIGDQAFYDCSGLRSITIPETVTSIGWEAFYGCSDLISVEIPEGVATIGGEAFRYCRNLESVSIPNSAMKIGEKAFDVCSNKLYDKDTIPGVQLVDGWVVGYTSSLSDDLDLAGARGIVDRAFGDAGLSSVAIPSNLTSIADEAFYGCSGLASISIPDSVTNIGYRAFYWCAGLTSISLPDSLTRIGPCAFEECRGLTSITIPDGVTSIEGGVFNLCSGLKTVYLSKSYPGCDPEVPEGCTVVRYEMVPLSVSSDSDRVNPSPGLHRIPSNIVYACSAKSPIPDVSDPFVRRVCAGWTGTGSVPASGTGTNVSFTPLRASSIAWLWERQMRLGGGPSGGTELWVPVSTSSTWFAAEDASAPDGFSFRSGDVDQGATSALETTMEGPGRLSFAWRIDANRGDYARFHLDGLKTCEITRLQPWSTNEVFLSSGGHTLRWEFERGSAAGGAAFLDEVRWCPRRTLTVESPTGSPSPGEGTHEVFWGDEIAACVVSPVLTAGGGTRRVCTGWTGTGSVPANGAGTNVVFTIKEDSSIAWNWRSEHWIDIAVASGGSTSFRPKWIADGETVEIELLPETRLYEIAVSGDTAAGVTLDGTILRVTADRPRTIRATITERKLALAVSSSDGTATPGPGIHLQSWGDRVAASVTEPPAADGTRRACPGWTGTGSVPASGEGTAVSFTMEEDSALSWLWRTEHWIAVETEGPLETDFKAGWRAADGTLAMNYDVLFDGGCEVSLGGDTNGVVLDAASRTVSIPCDRVRSLLLSVRPPPPDGPTLAEALDAPGLVWTSAGGNRWTPQTAVTADGEDAAESGDASGGDSILATEVSGPGTLSWSWRISADGTAGIDLEVDRTGPLCYVEKDQAGEWIENSVDIAGDGTHEVRFVFWNESGTASDRGWVDRVSWSGALAGVRETASTPAPVPYRWLVQKGLVSEGSQDAEFELAANAPAKNGRPVWECYVADLDPTKDDDFIARIEMADGEPRVSWIPSNAVGRIYRVYGKTALADGWSRPASPAHRFFQVRVALQNESADAFQGPVEVTFDAEGGTVDPTKRIYTQPGILGALPIPSRDGFTFLGWWTRETGGVRVNEETPVPWSDWTFHARWE